MAGTRWSRRHGGRRGRLRSGVAALVALPAVVGAVAVVAGTAQLAAAQTTTTLTATVPYSCTISAPSVGGTLLSGVAETLTATATVPASVQAGEPFAVGLAGSLSLPPSITGIVGPDVLGTVTALQVAVDATGATPATTADTAATLPFTAAVGHAGSWIATALGPVTLTAGVGGSVVLSVGSLTAGVTLLGGGYDGLTATDTCTVPSPVVVGNVPVVAAAPTPAVTALAPALGPPAGGTTVTLSGARLSGATAVDFGSTPATSVTVDPTGTEVTATAPAGTGTVPVTVTTPGGTTDGVPFTYAPLPTVTGISPASGPSDTSTLLTVTGTGLTGATAVSLGTTALTFAVVDDTQIDAVAPPGTGTEPVTVTTPGGTSAPSSAVQFTYVPVPDVTGLSPATGPMAGGTQVTITGTGLTGVTEVSFGGTPATFTVDSDTQITATSPAGEGNVSVWVQSPGGTAYAPGPFAYAPPLVTTGATVSYSCSLAVPAAGVSVTGVLLSADVTGTGPESVQSGQGASFEVGVAATSAGLASALANELGVTDISVSSLDLTVEASDATPTVSQLASSFAVGITVPPSILAGGIPALDFGPLDLTVGAPGTAVLTTGDLSATLVLQGGPDTGDDATVTCTGPSATVASVPVTTVPGNPPAVTGVSPATGPSAGGTTVTITGSGFTGAEAVYFGGTPATTFSVVSDTEITATAPPQDGGSLVSTPPSSPPIGLPTTGVDVTVTTPGGTSALSAADQYQYFFAPAPVVSGVSPGSAPAVGGSTVDINGAFFVGVTAVSFGGVTATDFTVLSPTEISVTVPPGAGTVDVTVTDAYGTSSTSTQDQFTYRPVPVVSVVLPHAGPLPGGQLVFMVGRNLTGATTVSFGTAPARFAVLSSVLIVAVAPAGSGTVDVTATTAGGTSATSAADQYTYLP